MKTEITPATLEASTYKQHEITGLSAFQVAQAIGFPPNAKDDPHKVKHSWQFQVAGRDCAVWDYKGSHLLNRFSAFGDADALRLVFGDALNRRAS